jgi:hypothetical protein
MRTTLIIKDDVLEKVTLLAGSKNRSQVTNEVPKIYVRERHLNKLLRLKGKLHLD